jgi:S-formylglutathione hydrolase FrmB
MTRHSRVFLIAALVLSVNAFIQNTATAAGPGSATAPQASATPQISHVQTIPFASKLVGKTLPYNVVLPVDYNQPGAREKRYPVLYLLHGLTGHYSNWLEKTRLADYARSYELIIVTPEGNDGWYTDSATVPTEKYESYILQELIPDVQRRYRTIETSAGRAIAGLSMGGYGALKFGVKNPEMFAFAGSMSGAVSAASLTQAELHGFEFIWRSLAITFGPADNPTHAANDLNKLFRELKAERIATLPYMYLDCGTEDPLLQSNRELADIFVSRKIPHEYRELPGAHAWPYWDAQVQEVLRVAVKKLRAPCNANC